MTSKACLVICYFDGPITLNCLRGWWVLTKAPFMDILYALKRIYTELNAIRMYQLLVEFVRTIQLEWLPIGNAGYAIWLSYSPFAHIFGLDLLYGQRGLLSGDKVSFRQVYLSSRILAQQWWKCSTDVYALLPWAAELRFIQQPVASSSTSDGRGRALASHSQIPPKWPFI